MQSQCPTTTFSVSFQTADQIRAKTKGFQLMMFQIIDFGNLTLILKPQGKVLLRSGQVESDQEAFYIKKYD